ncbi:MAG: YaiI/YqxD family protein [Clostridia bacterium]
MRLLIDADACPVVGLAIEIARARGAKVILVCDDAHVMEREGAQTVMVARGADSADFRLVNLIQARDIVVTQDYGLAAMCLAKGARVLNQNGQEYDTDNIDGLLSMRHVAKEARRAGRRGGRLKGPPKREKAQDERFAEALRQLMEKEQTT